MSQSSRREFLGYAGAALVTGLATRGATASAQPSETVRHAVIGLGSQGRRHAQVFSRFPDCSVVAVCDVDPERRAAAAQQVQAATPPALEDDYRRILEDSQIDSVSVATPDHWHVPIALAALKAGKHVYVEKPGAHNVHEALELSRAAERAGKCVQLGTQGRCGEALRAAVAFLQDGGLGKVRMAKAINHQHRRPIGRAPVSEPPEGVNYDLWLGPAPEHPFTANRWHYNWHWFWDYGTGDIGNDGIHQVDQARWGLGVAVPNAVTASGGQLYYDDDHETPDTQTVIYEYDDCYLMYEMRLWTDYTLEGHDNGVVFYGDDGTLEIGRRGAIATFIDGEEKHFGPYADITDHMRNFLDCMKSGRKSDLFAPIEESHVSTVLCLLGNVATRVGRKLVLDPQTGRCIGDPEAARLYTREYRQGYGLPELT